MKIIAVANQKGGLGKMIFVINIGISLDQVACGERGIQKGGAFGDGEVGGSGDEDKE